MSKEFDRIAEIMNRVSRPSCLIIHPGLEKSFKQLEGFKPDTVFKDSPYCPEKLEEFYKPFIGTYKDIPVVKTDNLKKNEIYALYKGEQDFEAEPILLPWETKWKEE